MQLGGSRKPVNVRCCGAPAGPYCELPRAREERGARGARGGGPDLPASAERGAEAARAARQLERLGAAVHWPGTGEAMDWGELAGAAPPRPAPARSRADGLRGADACSRRAAARAVAAKGAHGSARRQQAVRGSSARREPWRPQPRVSPGHLRRRQDTRSRGTQWEPWQAQPGVSPRHMHHWQAVRGRGARREPWRVQPRVSPGPVRPTLLILTHPTYGLRAAGRL